MKIMVKGGSNLTDNEEKYMIQNNSEIEQNFNDDRAEKNFQERNANYPD